MSRASRETQQPVVHASFEDEPAPHFALIARHYDRLNRLMSFGQDSRWRSAAAEAAALPADGRVLDVGVGTGEMARALLERWPEAEVHGVDPEPEMMRRGRIKRGLGGVVWVQADGLRLPYPDGCFDAAVSAFVIRNVRDRRGALAEQRRVVRPGGRVVCLEMSWPPGRVIRALFHFYFAGIMPRITGRVSGQPAAYRYLPRSVQGFVTPGELSSLMEETGLGEVTYRPLGLGTVALHVGRRG